MVAYKSPFVGSIFIYIEHIRYIRYILPWFGFYMLTIIPSGAICCISTVLLGIYMRRIEHLHHSAREVIQKSLQRFPVNTVGLKTLGPSLKKKQVKVGIIFPKFSGYLDVPES